MRLLTPAGARLYDPRTLPVNSTVSTQRGNTKSVGVSFSRGRDYFRAYLDEGPLFAAIVRGVECLLLQTAKPFTQPALDLGCGDGFFASLIADEPFFAGIDPSAAALRRARGWRAHRELIQANGDAMPLPSNFFNTVLANSVLEHIAELDGTLEEISRVLRPDGRLLITAPSHRFAEMLLGSTVLRRVGAHRLSRAYGDWFNRHSRHFHTDDAETWIARLERHGFIVERCHYYLSAAALRAFDLAHYLSVPRWVSRQLTGKWVAVPHPISNRVWEHWLRRFYDAQPVQEGPYLFLEARRR